MVHDLTILKEYQSKFLKNHKDQEKFADILNKKEIYVLNIHNYKTFDFVIGSVDFLIYLTLTKKFTISMREFNGNLFTEILTKSDDNIKDYSFLKIPKEYLFASFKSDTETTLEYFANITKTLHKISMGKDLMLAALFGHAIYSDYHFLRNVNGLKIFSFYKVSCLAKLLKTEQDIKNYVLYSNKSTTNYSKFNIGDHDTDIALELTNRNLYILGKLDSDYNSVILFVNKDNIYTTIFLKEHDELFRINTIEKLFDNWEIVLVSNINPRSTTSVMDYLDKNYYPPFSKFKKFFRYLFGIKDQDIALLEHRHDQPHSFKRGKLDKKQALEILELPITATSEEIKKQYRKLVLLHHPDKNKQENDDKFKQI